ncbi:MAG: hypothetical protein ACFB50_19605 [Rubrobacteraceae bacterium]
MGILAYGSLFGDPGEELGPLVVDRIEGVNTPFPVEFARQSRTRDGAPTLVPFREGNARVKATVLVLEERVSESEAADILWRRETRQEGSGERYIAPAQPDPNTVLVQRLQHFEGLDVVLYAEIGANIPDLSPRGLAERAIRSAESHVGRRKRDGITYLLDVKKNGVETPLMPEYEKEILRLTATETLEQAREKLVGNT